MAQSTTAIDPWYVVLQAGKSIKTQNQYVMLLAMFLTHCGANDLTIKAPYGWWQVDP